MGREITQKDEKAADNSAHEEEGKGRRLQQPPPFDALEQAGQQEDAGGKHKAGREIPRRA